MAAHNYGLAFAELERAIIEIAPAHIPTANAPDSWAKLQTWYTEESRHIWRGLQPIPVWNGASDFTIYCSPEGNYAFRAWHDFTHLMLHLSFCFADEIRIAHLHFATMKRRGLSPLACAALFFDTAGQSFYQDMHGDFPVHQRNFVEYCLLETRGRVVNPYWLESVARSVADSGIQF